MKLISFLILLSMLSCSEGSSDLTRISRFQYPSSLLEEQRTFIYQKINSPDTAFKFHQVVEKGGIKVLSSVQGDGTLKFDSAISAVEEPFKLKEIYRFDYDTLNKFIGLTKGAIKRNEISGNAFYSKVEYKKGYSLMEITSEHEFQKDTSFLWKGETIPSLYFEGKTKMEIDHKYIPFIGDEREYFGYSIYAEGLGLVKYGTSIEEEMVEWELKEIK